MKTAFVFLAVVLWGSISCVIAQDTPDWAMELPNIPEMEEHYQGLGITEGSDDINEDWARAINRARANLISQIKVHIVSEMTSRIIETEENGNFNVESYFDEQILASSDIMLQDVPVRRWYDSDHEVYYAYMVVPFSYVNDLRRDYLNNAEYVYDFYSTLATELIEKGEIYSALLIYLEGSKNLIKIMHNIEKVGMQDHTTQEVAQLLIQFGNMVCDFFKRIEITSHMSETQVLDPQASYPGLLEGEVVYNGYNNSILVTSQFPLKAEPLGDFEANLYLTQKGERYFLHLDEILKAGEFNEVEISIFPPDKIQFVKEVVSLSACKQHIKKKEQFTVKGKKNTRVIIYIEEIENGVQTGKRTVIDAMRSELAGKGFVTETGEANHCAQYDKPFDGYLICGEVLIEDRSNPRPNFYFATASGNIEIIDASKKRVLEIIQSDEIREGGNGYQQARINSLKIISQNIIDKTSDYFKDRFNIVSH